MYCHFHQLVKTEWLRDTNHKIAIPFTIATSSVSDWLIYCGKIFCSKYRLPSIEVDKWLICGGKPLKLIKKMDIMYFFLFLYVHPIEFLI